jgi:Putative zinc-finger
VARAVKMRCDEVWREVSNYLDDEVSAGLRTRMEQHFKSCKRCTAVLDGTRNVVRLVGDPAISDLLTVCSDCLISDLTVGRPEGATRGRKIEPHS